MKRFLFTVICAILLASCNDEIDLTGRSGTNEFLKNDFSGVSVQDGFELYLLSGDTSKFKIESDENIVNHVKYEVKNEILYFYKEPATEFPSNALVKISVTKDSLEVLMLMSSKAQIVDTLRTKEIRLVCSGKSDFTGRLECKKLHSIIDNSTIKLTGISDTVQANIDNGSSVKLFDLESNKVNVNILGGSFAEVLVYEEFEVKIKEKSILHYKGTPIIRQQVLDDDSEIEKIEQ
ncbi:MAG: DUF2807 domain-containing protein [Prevotellaceae bacterium]|jgi:hypothetical protein|nr:DUF2807 domain-containing protein [Prevotellaceae bacterium]